MKATRIGNNQADRSCESCISWGMDGDESTFRICLLKNEHVSCSDSCKHYVEKINEVNDNKGDTEWNI